MLKIITIITKFVVVTIIALLFGACNFGDLNSIKGSGNVTTEQRKVSGDFTNVEVSDDLEVEIQQSDKLEITVIADDNIQKEIVTKIEDGVLTISSNYGNYSDMASKKVIVKMPIIEGLQASSSSRITNKLPLKGNSITVSSSSAANINVTLEYENIQLSSSSGSNQEIKGKALSVEVKASSGSEINANELLANEIVAKSSSGSSINISPIVSLQAKASSGSSITYHKIPKSIQKEEHSGGNISQE